MDLSYAQNMEDMHLSLLFEGEAAGFYIDIGGGHPVADNVSFRASLAGWHGIVVEPQAALHRLYSAIRPRDIALDVLVGRSAGEAAFHAVDRLHGFSTMVETHAKGAAGFGVSYATNVRSVTTLAALCAQHRHERIDWLKIDVEGAEADVLAGNDWARFRPRVVLIEAIAPGSMEPSHEAWEPDLLAAGYRFAFFDGLNRWYVADEAAALASRFPPASLDWGTVRHLYGHGRAPERPDHPDHALAIALEGLDMASLPLVDHETIYGFLVKNLTVEALSGPFTDDALARFEHLWLGTEPHRFRRGSARGESLDAALRAMATSEPFFAALGRIAAAYDGGFIMENDAT